MEWAPERRTAGRTARLARSAGRAWAILVLLAATLPGTPAAGAVINVSPGSDLQAAIDSAGANADVDNTILFAPGVYNVGAQLTVGSAFVGRTLTFQSSGGAAATILDGGNATRILRINSGASGGHVVIDGLTFRNGRASGSAGAVQSLQTELTVRDSVFVSNRADRNGGALTTSGHNDLSQRAVVLLHIEGTSFDDNLADGSGGAIYVPRTSAEVQTSTFTGNEATGQLNGQANTPRGSGGAIYVYTGSIDIDGSTFTANVSSYAGGALRASASDALVTGSTFDGNSVVRNVPSDPNNLGDGGAIQGQAIDAAHTYTFEDNVMVNNVAGGIGGGVHLFTHVSASAIELRRNRFESNSADTGGGIAIQGCPASGSGVCPGGGQSGAAVAVIEGNELIGNDATTMYGAGTIKEIADLSFERNEVRDNTATDDYAGLRIRDLACTVIARNLFHGNVNPVATTAPNGALTLQALRNCPTSARSAVVENNFFWGNRGTSTGALGVAAVERVDVVSNSFSDNIADGTNGAAVTVRSETRFVNNLFSGADPAIADGFAIRIGLGGFSLQITRNGFFDNQLGVVYDPVGVLGTEFVYETVAELNGVASASLNVEVDPVFVAPGTGDLHLQATSGALDQGSCSLLTSPASDVDGDPRPNGAACDLGADERTVHQLTVTRSGSGGGTVTSQPAGIDCGSDCSEGYAGGESVTLDAVPDADSEFGVWSGDPDCADGQLTMSGPRTCDARFDLKPLLTASKSGSGSGTVTSSPVGIACGADCDERYGTGTSVDLMVAPDAGSAFTGWSGDPDCTDATVLMNSDRSCIATLVLLRTLDVNKNGAGSGTVSSSPGGIVCGGDCSESYPEGTTVALSVVPDYGSEFGGWSGPADCSDGVVSLLADLSCTATLAPCSDPSELFLPAQTVTGTETFEACNRLVAGAGGFAVSGASANVTFRSGNDIEFENDFSVGLDATFQAVIGPP